MGWSRNRSRIASNFWRKISGTPGRMYTFRIRTVGNRTVSPPTSSAPSGIAAILRCESFSRSRKCRSRMPTRMIPAVFGMAPGDSTMLEYGRPREGDAMIQLSGWALALGASSGFGEATSLALARAGLNIFGVHLDRKATLGNVERIVSEIKALGHEAVFFNVNAADPDKRAEVVSQMERVLEERGEVGTVRVLLHSLAFGTLKLYVADPMKEVVTPAQMDMTLDVMAHSLVYWVQEVVGRGLMTRGGRIYAMTSSGGSRVLPFYGPVSAAKAALESHVRQLAAELAPQGITANAVRAGVTDTPALQKIPRHEAIIAEARRRNPSGRMTTTEDVARAIVVLAHPDTYWITGNVIGVDGGEDIVG